MSTADDIPEEQAAPLVERIFGLLEECRAIQGQLGTPPHSAEPHSAMAERELYGLLLAVLEAGLLRTMDEALNVLQRAGQPLGPRGEEWLRRQERTLGEGRKRGRELLDR